VPGKRRQGETGGKPTFDAGVEELYGLPLDQFIAARTELVKQAKAAKETDSAAELARLAKPNAVAWLANQLVRAHRNEVDDLLELGQTLRAATAALDAARLRELSGQQRRKVAALVALAKQLGSSAGQPASEATARALEDTLHAALADPEAADALVAGRLSTGLASSGFPGMALGAAPAAPKKAASKASKSSKASKAEKAPPEPRELQRAEANLAAAQDDRDETAEAREQAHQAAASAAADAEAAAQEVERLSEELDEARQAQRAADKTSRQAVRALADAERAARQASARLERATARHDDLARPGKR
jgi:hypothetical protein